VGRNGRWHKEYTIQRRLLATALCHDQVSGVDRIKAAAKNPNSHPRTLSAQQTGDGVRHLFSLL
jgi:hypothetical protein